MTQKEPEALRLNWSNGQPNFGDALSELVVAHMSGRPIVSAAPRKAEIFAIGSIMQRPARAFRKPRDHRPVLWGTGMKAPLDINFVPNVDIRALRGPNSAAILRIGPVPFGDPGLLISDMATNDVEQTSDIGIVPHHTDFDARDSRDIVANFGSRKGEKLIDPRTNDVFDVVNQIRSCRHIYSASLHGMVIADAFGIPNTWIAARVTHGFKHLDYFLSVERPYSRPVAFEDIAEVDKQNRSVTKLGYLDGIERSRDAIRNAFPEELKA